MSHVKIAVALCVSVTLAGGILLAQGAPASDPPMPVTIETPGTSPGVTSLQAAGAWPLTIQMVANQPMGVGTYKVPEPFPIGTQQAFFVFSDPDDCFSLSMAHDPDMTNPPCPAGTDEIYLEFVPSINLPNLVQQRVDKAMLSRLGEMATLRGYSGVPGRNTATVYVGPQVGSGPYDKPCDDENGYVGCDNYGYGASPSISSLVVLSDRGVGLVWNPVNFNLKPRARNLAGFVNSVAWTLNDCGGTDGCATGTSAVTAHMNVPVGLFTPVVRIDFGGPLVDSDGNVVKQRDRWYQIDGGTWTLDNAKLLRDVLNGMVTTVRIFVVSGRAPDEVHNMDRDPVIDARDVALMGYTVISQERVIRFRTYHQEEEAGIGIMYDYIPDGMVPPPLPAGPGGINQIPR